MSWVLQRTFGTLHRSPLHDLAPNHASLQAEVSFIPVVIPCKMRFDLGPSPYRTPMVRNRADSLHATARPLPEKSGEDECRRP